MGFRWAKTRIYRELNRLNAADHSNNTLTENGITYDKMGNISDLTRTGAGAKDTSLWLCR